MSLILNAQDNTIQALSLAGDSYYRNEPNSSWIDWRLDLGVTTIELNQTNNYFFTAGLLQPNINRFNNIATGKHYQPAIQLRNHYRGYPFVLCASTPDLIIHGYTVFDANGRVLITDTTKIASSFLVKPIDLSLYANGIYYVLVYYLPDNFGASTTINYWTTTLKLLKQ